MMGLNGLVKDAWEMGLVLVILLVGGMIALWSGVRRPASADELRVVAGNLSRMILRVLGYLAVLLVLQYWIGMRPVLGW
jgi:hypothetical protein